MFAHNEIVTRAIRELFDAQMAYLNHVTHAVMDVGVRTSEQQVDTMKTLLANATVATRQCLFTSNTHGWLTPAPQDRITGQLSLAAPPAGAPAATAPDSIMAVGLE
ncbi:MAG: hypothetical protein V4508_07615 [Pseudomonadota bacterium]